MYDFQPVLQRGIKLAWGPSTKLVTGPIISKHSEEKCNKILCEIFIEGSNGVDIIQQ